MINGSDAEPISIVDDNYMLDEVSMPFFNILEDVLGRVQAIHSLVSGVGSKDQATKMRPHLLSSLVHAFQKILDRSTF